MSKFDFTDREAAWKSVSGKKWVRPLPLEDGNFRLFHDIDVNDPSPEHTIHHDYNPDGRVLDDMRLGPLMGHLDNIMGGWTEPFSRAIQSLTEAVEEVAEKPTYEHTEHKVSFPMSDEAISKMEALAKAARGEPTKSASHARYGRLVQETFDKVIELGVKKGGEYAGDFDRLANFRRNGNNLSLPMETIWAVYAGKHWDAVMQYIKDQRTGTTRDRMETIDGRVDDLIVYLLLFKLMLEEQDEGNLRG